VIANRRYLALLTGVALVACQGEVKSSANTPPSFTEEGVMPLSAVHKIGLPILDLNKIAAEDELRELSGDAPRYAIPNKVKEAPATSGTWETLADGRLLWRLRYESPGARSLSFGFSTFKMAPGSKLFVYSADGKNLLRAFTDEDNEKHGQLWTPVVPGSEVVLELVIPAGMRPFTHLQLTSVNVGYRGFKTDDLDKSGSCNVDVVCAQGDEYRDIIRSVAVIGTGSGTFCTGFLVNNVANDMAGYFMTAAHCGIDESAAPSLVTYWNYETSRCGGTPDGQLNQFNTGAVFKASRSESDFSLVELDDPPLAEANVFWAGWDATDADATRAIAIHHPATDEKRISFENNPTTTTGYGDESSPGDGTHVRITDWDVGTTEPGSSGSPLFNQDKRIIGQLHGGGAACGNDLSDWYGRFSVSWKAGNTNSTRLSDWLDPNDTGTLQIDGRNACDRPSVDFTISPNPATAGETVTFTATATGGSGPYNYAWDLDADGDVDCTTATCTFVYPTNFEDNVKLTVTDATDCASVRTHALVAVDPNCPAVRFQSTNVPVSIPDNTPAGVVSTLDVTSAGAVSSLKLSVDIKHTYISDLIVSLISPSGAEMIVHNQAGGGADDLIFTDRIISGVTDEPLTGTWKLKVADVAQADVGEITSWGMYVTPKCEAAP
jgi:hypothetical protein